MRRGLVAALTVGLTAAVALAAVALAWSWQRPPVPREPAGPRPNVVLIVGCTVRADQTSLFAPIETTPFLAELAARGALFEDAHTAAPWTRPASAALITGVHPGHLGMLEPAASSSDRVLPEAALTLAERLREAGYATIGRTANPNLDRAYGFDQGFDDYGNLSPWWRADGVTKIGGTDVVDEVLEALDAAPAGRPVYLQLVLVDAHQPFDLGIGAAARWRGQELPRRVMRYRAMLRVLDAAVSELVRGLASRGLDTTNTVFAFANDHGEGLRYPLHHGKGHGRYLYPSSTRMVWLMAGPGVAPGTRVGGLASQVDLAPTLLELAGLPAPDGIDGRSWAAQVGGRTPRTDRERAFSATMFADVERGAIFAEDRACITDFGTGTAQVSERNRRKPVFESGCFDRADADFTTRIDDPALAAELATWWEELVRRNERAPAGDATVPADVRDALRALGYVDEEQEAP